LGAGEVVKQGQTAVVVVTAKNNPQIEEQKTMTRLVEIPAGMQTKFFPASRPATISVSFRIL
jgi:hypothetical protein